MPPASSTTGFDVGSSGKLLLGAWTDNDVANLERVHELGATLARLLQPHAEAVGVRARRGGRIERGVDQRIGAFVAVGQAHLDMRAGLPGRQRLAVRTREFDRADQRGFRRRYRSLSGRTGPSVRSQRRFRRWQARRRARCLPHRRARPCAAGAAIARRRRGRRAAARPRSPGRISIAPRAWVSE